MTFGKSLFYSFKTKRSFLWGLWNAMIVVDVVIDFLIKLYIRTFSSGKMRARPQNWLEVKLFHPFLTSCTFIAVVSVVSIVYSTILVYVPTRVEIAANITGPYKCTTKQAIFNVSDHTCTWSSCVDWCLNKVKVTFKSVRPKF